MSNTKCPKCGGRMIVATSHRLGSFQNTYRRCGKCPHEDRALIKPAEVVKILPVRKRTTPPDE